MAGFSVNIGADTAQLAQGLSKAQADLLQFSNAIVVNANGAANALAHIPAALRPINPVQLQALNNAVQKLKQDIQSAPAGINATAAAMNNLNKGASAANAAVLDFSRVIQDLPFGLVGIINNVQQLPGTLQRLSAASKETGKSVGSLLLSSITGVGGLGLAVAAVTSGLLIYQNGIAGFTKKTKEAKDEAQKLAELLKSVKGAAETAFEGVGTSQGEIIQVQALAAAVGDETRSQVERGRALERLKAINKEYFGDLKLEEDSLRQLTPLVNEYTNALIQQAVVRELQSEIGKIGAVFAKQKKDVADARDALNNYKESLGVKEIGEAGRRTFVLDDTLNQLNANLTNAQKTLAPTAAKFNELSAAIRDATFEGLKYKSTQGGGGKEDDLLKKRLEALKELQKSIEDVNKNTLLRGASADVDSVVKSLTELELKIGDLKVQIAERDAKKNGLSGDELAQKVKSIKDETQNNINRLLENQRLLVQFRTSLRVDVASIDQKELESKVAKATGLDKKIPEINIQQVRINFEKEGLKFKTPAALINAFEDAAKDFEKKAKSILETAIIDSFIGIGEGIGEGLAKGDIAGGIAKAGENLLHIIGSVIADIGKQMIIASKLVITLQKILESAGFGPASLGVGLALIAVGSAIKNIKFNTPKFATGGIVTGPIVGQIGEMHRPEVIMPLDRLPQMLRSIGGGGNDFQLIPIFNSEQLYLMAKRGERRAGRKF